MCLDPPFQIGDTKAVTKECLVLSFGTGQEIDFDLQMRIANCEVHMFDINEQMNFTGLTSDDSFFHFHEVSER